MLAALRTMADRPAGLSVRRSGVTERASTVIRSVVVEAFIRAGRGLGQEMNVLSELSSWVRWMPRPYGWAERRSRNET